MGVGIELPLRPPPPPRRHAAGDNHILHGLPLVNQKVMIFEEA